MADEIRVKIKPVHLWMTGVSAGLMEGIDLLQNLPPTLKSTPGVALALSTLSAAAHENRATLIGKHLAAIARAGLDVGRYKGIKVDPNKSELICEFYDPDLFDSDSEDDAEAEATEERDS